MSTTVHYNVQINIQRVIVTSTPNAHVRNGAPIKDKEVVEFLTVKTVTDSFDDAILVTINHLNAQPKMDDSRGPDKSPPALTKPR